MKRFLLSVFTVLGRSEGRMHSAVPRAARGTANIAESYCQDGGEARRRAAEVNDHRYLGLSMRRFPAA
jgi:putative hemolysin